MNIIFMGTPDFAVPSLEAIYNAGYTIDLVITQVDRPRGRGKKMQETPVKKKALEYGIEVYQPEDINSQESIEKIRALKPDFIVVAAYGQIIKEDILQASKYDIINVHASLLPKYRGASPINWAIVNGETETGITIMEVAKGLDTGDMIVRESIEIGSNDDASIIHDKLADLGGELIVRAIEGLAKGDIIRVPQDDLKSSYAPKLSRQDGLIDWKKPAEAIRNKIRGFKPWPSAYTDYKGERLTIHKAIVLEEEIKGQPGQIIRVEEDGLCINTGSGVLKVVELQFPGIRAMKASDYLRGNSIEEGVILK